MATLDSAPCLLMLGLYSGAPADGLRALRPLLDVGTPQFTRRQRAPTTRSTTRCSRCCPARACRRRWRPSAAATSRRRSAWKAGRSSCDYFATTPNPYNIMVLEPYGAARDGLPAGGLGVHPPRGRLRLLRRLLLGPDVGGLRRGDRADVAGRASSASSSRSSTARCTRTTRCATCPTSASSTGATRSTSCCGSSATTTRTASSASSRASPRTAPEVVSAAGRIPRAAGRARTGPSSSASGTAGRPTVRTCCWRAATRPTACSCSRRGV